MALTNYGVLIGQLSTIRRDTPDDKGKYYHENLEITINGVTYKAAIDVDSKESNVGVEWRVLELTQTDLQSIVNLPTGWHTLGANAASGAIDYVRSPFLRLPNLVLKLPDLVYIRPKLPPVPPEWNLLKRVTWHTLAVLQPTLLFRLFKLTPDMYWTKGSSLDAFSALENVLNQGTQIHVFGERFKNNGNGVHDVHQNQGDPLASQWAGLDAIWQDGATIVRRNDGTFVGFFNKFTSQSYITDDLGHPK